MTHGAPPFGQTLAICSHTHVRNQQTIAYCSPTIALFSFSEIAGRANVQKVVVFEFEIRMIGHGAKMVPMKMTDAVHPLLAFEAVHVEHSVNDFP